MAAVKENIPASTEAPATKSAGKLKKVVAKKARASPAHPPYIEMINEALTTLKERNGSSQYAIKKFIEENHKSIPSNFRKLLLINLRKFVANGRLVKIKASYKLPAAKKTVTTVAKPKKAVTAAVKPKKAVTPKKASKPKSKAVEKTKAAPAKVTGTKRKAVAAVKPAKVAKTTAKSTPSKKAVPAVKKAVPAVKKAVPAVKKAVAKKAVVKTVKPKSVKSPAKRALSKRGKK